MTSDMGKTIRAKYVSMCKDGRGDCLFAALLRRILTRAWAGYKPVHRGDRIEQERYQ